MGNVHKEIENAVTAGREWMSPHEITVRAHIGTSEEKRHVLVSIRMRFYMRLEQFQSIYEKDCQEICEGVAEAFDD